MSERKSNIVTRLTEDAFRDDDSDVEEEAKRAVASLRPVKPLPNRSTARSIRAREPEVVPDRFLHRSGPEIPSAVQSVLDGSTLLRRSIEHMCGWKGCDAGLGSESLLKKHLSICKHTAEAIFKAPVSVPNRWIFALTVRTTSSCGNAIGNHAKDHVSIPKLS